MSGDWQMGCDLQHKHSTARDLIRRTGLIVIPALLAVSSGAGFAQQGQSLLEPLPDSNQTSLQTAPQTVAPAAQEPTAQAAAEPQRLSQLFYQLQVLQQEVQELRGLVEEQSYQLNRLARDQQEQYIDLDGRIAGMTNGRARPSGGSAARPSGASNGVTGGSTGSGASTGTVVGAPVTSGSSESEREVYTRAFDLMKARQYDESARAFDQLIVSYPNGQYTPNAFYWLGELYLAQSDSEQARQSFAQVLNLYPDHPKVPDSLYKMGVVHHRLGDNPGAIEYFERVAREYPNSSAAGLATRYMAELK
jgi:tol-pal system protein YbgF